MTKNLIRSSVQRLRRHLASSAPTPDEKADAELRFWRNELRRYEEWYRGEAPTLYNTPSPAHAGNADADEPFAALRAWHRLHQEPKYRHDLNLDKYAFGGQRVLDLGAGPIPSATCFHDAEIYCLDPLLSRYIEAGFPIHCYGPVRFIQAHAEAIPVEDHYFHAVISVNSLDHVDDVDRTALEIRRVMKPDGHLRIHTHYHPPTTCEPISLDDERMSQLFSWCADFDRLRRTTTSFSDVAETDEMFALWSNRS